MVSKRLGSAGRFSGIAHSPVPCVTWGWATLGGLGGCFDGTQEDDVSNEPHTLPSTKGFAPEAPKLPKTPETATDHGVVRKKLPSPKVQLPEKCPRECHCKNSKEILQNK